MTSRRIDYKDRLFNYIFGAEENRAWTLDLYNAVNGSHYSDPSAIEINTIKEILYLGMRNDVSFLLAGEMNLYEQQSGYNPNMPVRLLQYSGNLYEQYIIKNSLNKYGSRRIALPVPKLIVFYNGKADQPDEQILQLRDSFPEGSDPDIDVRVRMLNINYGKNEALLNACRPLKEYAWLIMEIRKEKTRLEKERNPVIIETLEEKKTRVVEELRESIDKGITSMPADFILKPFLESHRAEVMGMLMEEYSEAEVMELFREEGREEGRAEGREEGINITRLADIRNMMAGLNMSAQQAMDILKISVDDRQKYIGLLD